MIFSSHFHFKKRKKILKSCSEILFIFLHYSPKLPKKPNRKNSCFKMWLIDATGYKTGAATIQLAASLELGSLT